MTDATTRVFAPPGDLVALTSSEPLLFELAEKIWEPASARDEGDAIAIEIGRGDGADANGSLRGTADPTFSFEEELRWVHEPAEFRCEVPGVFDVHINLLTAGIRADLSPELSLFLSKKSSSFFSSSLRSFLARTLLEAPTAILLARRGWRALHAGAVAGPKGAVVVRGGSGAGKSTLVAAAHAAGLGVLGDESLLVSRDDPDDLASSVRELTLRADSADLVGLLSRTRPSYSGGEEKRRVDLFALSRPGARAARRASTLLLGPRVPGPSRLVRLSPPQFLEEFARGEIPQEHVDGGAGAIAHAWAEAGGMRLDGASDLHGAVALLKSLVT